MQETNESLAMRSSAISEQDLEDVRAEAAQRVAAAERKVTISPVALAQAPLSSILTDLRDPG